MVNIRICTYAGGYTIYTNIVSTQLPKPLFSFTTDSNVYRARKVKVDGSVCMWEIHLHVAYNTIWAYSLMMGQYVNIQGQYVNIQTQQSW